MQIITTEIFNTNFSKTQKTKVNLLLQTIFLQKSFNRKLKINNSKLSTVLLTVGV